MRGERSALSLLRPRVTRPEPIHVPGGDSCGICGDVIRRTYFRLNGVTSCGNCADEAQQGRPQEGHVVYGRSLMLGVVAAVVGMAVYAAFTIATGIEIGYMGVVVGWLVGKAMIFGSHGMGGRKCQMTALLLTYLAVSAASLPIAVGLAAKDHHPIRVQQSEEQPGAGAAEDSSSVAVRVALVVGYGLLAPILNLENLTRGLIGLAILCVGLRAAWQATRARELKVEGPFKAVAFRV